MASETEWIIKALKNDPTKKMVGIAEVLGLDKSAVSKMLKPSGGRKLGYAEAIKIADYLGVPLPTYLARDQPAAAPGFAESFEAGDTAPVYPVKKDDKGRWFLNRHGAPIDRQARAPNFLHSPHVFGVYVGDDAMAPRFKLQEIAWIDPARPISAGGDVMLVGKADAAGWEPFVLAELVGAMKDALTITQHRDKTETRYAMREWSALHVLARY